MLLRALTGTEAAFGAGHVSTLNTVNNLGILYFRQGQLGEAEKMLQRALTGYEAALGAERVKTYVPALDSMRGLGNLYSASRPQEAQRMLGGALAGYAIVRGDSADVCHTLKRQLDELAVTQRSNEGITETASQAVINKEDASLIQQTERRFARF